MSLLIAGGIAAAAALGGSLVNRGSQNSANRANKALADQQNQANLEYQQRQFDFNNSQAELEYERNLALWNMQNEYNSPMAQKQRLTDAGLNPNLVYGSGSATTAASAAAPYSAAKYQAPHAERATVNAPQLQVDPYQAVQISQSLGLVRAQREQVEAQTDAVKQSTKNSAIDELIKAVELGGHKLTLQQREQLYDVTIEQARENLRKTTGEVANLHHLAVNIQTRSNLNEQQLDKVAQEIRNLRLTHDVESFKLRLLKLGVSDRDGLITRVASRLILANENEITSFIDGLFPRARGVLTPKRSDIPPRLDPFPANTGGGSGW